MWDDESGSAVPPLHHAGLPPRAVHALQVLAKDAFAGVLQLPDEVVQELRAAPPFHRDLKQPIEQRDAVPRLIQMQGVTGHIDHSLDRIEPYAALMALLTRARIESR